jgi:O-antigen ligase/polysaccharide polymerase Wzy-like membrane protein
VNHPRHRHAATYPHGVKDRFPLFAALGVGAILVQESLARQGSTQAGVTVLVAVLAFGLLVLPGPERIGPKAERVPYPLVLFVVYSGARLVMEPSTQGLQNWLVWFLFPAALALVSRRTTEGTPPRVYRWWLPATLVAASAYGLLVLIHQPGYAGTLYSARGMGWILLIAMSLVVGAQLWKSAFLYWPVWYSVLIIGATLTRAAGFLALLSATGLAALSRRGRLTFIRFAALVSVMGLVGYYAATQIAVVRDRFTQGDAAVQVGSTDLNTSGRLQLWSATWHAVPEHPWIGHGPGQAQYFIAQRFVTIEHPHNEYLRLLYDTGWVGLVLWGLGMLLLVRGCWRRMRRAGTPLRRGTHLAGLLAMVDFLLGSITDNLTVGIGFVLICATVVGMSLGLPEETEPAVEPAASEDEGREAPFTAAGRWVG